MPDNAGSESIRAYEFRERASSYDADMDLMHPNRTKLVEMALDVLPFDNQTRINTLDMGVGTGFFSHAVLPRFPNCQIIAVDGASSMIEMAKVRLSANLNCVDFRVGDLRHLKKMLNSIDTGRVVC